MVPCEFCRWAWEFDWADTYCWLLQFHLMALRDAPSFLKDEAMTSTQGWKGSRLPGTFGDQIGATLLVLWWLLKSF